tara:strand:- start:514 stop:720 length:207 start_codon:yes stop_codon:yes gene_type:complete
MIKKKPTRAPYGAIMPCFKVNRNLLVVRRARRRAQVDKALGSASDIIINIFGVLVVFALGLLAYMLLV